MENRLKALNGIMADPSALRVIAFALMLLLGSAGASGAERVHSVPPDHSLSVSDYVARGLPNPRAKWSVADQDAARDVLWTLSEENPALLPRSGSPMSGVVFNRILDSYFESESLDVFGVLSMSELMTADAKQLERVARKRSFAALYAPRADGLNAAIPAEVACATCALTIGPLPNRPREARGETGPPASFAWAR